VSDAGATSRRQPPLPPHELRVLVGATAEELYDNPTGELLWGLPREAFDFVLDWGCGCGRLARKMLLQDEPPRRYLGVDLHRGMVRWCSQTAQLFSKELLSYSLDDLRRQFYSIKDCNPTCSIGCSRTASAYDEWRAQPRPAPVHVEEAAPELEPGQLTR